MVLYQNNFIVLNYEPTTDILTVDWPQIESYLLHEVERSLQTLVDYVRNYDVKRLLIDAGKATSSPELVDSSEYKRIIMEFAINLNKTRLQKSARVVALDKNRETKTQKVAAEIVQQTGFAIQSKNFDTRAEAMAWLKA
ncbi:hypothetical protein [Adhaeribacter aquaticus]|uniref:hypothetical protein n=1 Tax=Adhaeribacter aquaticus TaxID=299567 RepID=UPI0003FB86A7|nr:hypothetical protein [Adhaeribacter aquaticus]